jgi:3-hydroxyacyl-[acyl-carrier-protein] dehydratase
MRHAIASAALDPVSLTADTAEQSFCFAESFIGFGGHFPGYPILPAILQVLLAQWVAEQLCGHSLEFMALERAKFTRELHPGEQILVKVVLREATDLLRYRVELFSGQDKAATFSLVFNPGEHS